MPDGSSAHTETAAGSDRMLHVVYGLYALTFIVGIAAIAAIIIAYLQRGKMLNALQHSHVVWQIRTFWICLLVGLIASTLPFLLGFLGGLILFLVPVPYFIYRIAKGWYLLADHRPIDDPGALF